MNIPCKRIRKRRLELKMTQDELAKKTGYKTRSSIAKIEKGLVDLSQSKLVEFAKALNTTPAYLMEWDDEDKREFEIEQDKKHAAEKERQIISTLYDFLEALGYEINYFDCVNDQLDFTEDPSLHSIKDYENNLDYKVDEAEVKKLENAIISFAKYQMHVLLSNSEKYTPNISNSIPFNSKFGFK